MSLRRVAVFNRNTGQHMAPRHKTLSDSTMSRHGTRHQWTSTRPTSPLNAIVP